MSGQRSARVAGRSLRGTCRATALADRCNRPEMSAIIQRLILGLLLLIPVAIVSLLVLRPLGLLPGTASSAPADFAAAGASPTAEIAIPSIRPLSGAPPDSPTARASSVPSATARVLTLTPMAASPTAATSAATSASETPTPTSAQVVVAPDPAAPAAPVAVAAQAAPEPAPPTTVVRAPQATPTTGTESARTVSTPVPVAPPADGALVPPPTAAVQDFYGAVAAGQFDRAASYWSSRMRAAYPPSENIVQRFSGTKQITLERVDLVQLDNQAGTARVAMQLLEVRGTPSVATRYAGTWSLTRSPDGRWLLDAPNLYPA